MVDYWDGVGGYFASGTEAREILDYSFVDGDVRLKGGEDGCVDVLELCVVLLMVVWD